MNDWALDILRQGGWDWWTLLCAVASLVLLSYALVGKPWHRPHAVLSVTLIAIGVGGTLLILIWPRLHDSRLGLVWTFLLLTILSATFYLNIHAHLGTTKLATLLTLRTIALGLMVLMFFEPILRRTTTAPSSLSCS